MKKMSMLMILLLTISLSGCGDSSKESGELDWFEWDSESSENSHYNNLFLSELPAEFSGYRYNEYACQTSNAFDLDKLVCEFSTGTLDKGTWNVKVVIYAKPDDDSAIAYWQDIADYSYTDEAQIAWAESNPNNDYGEVTKVGTYKWIQHRVTYGNFEMYELWSAYENTVIFVQESGSFGAPVYELMESVAKQIVDEEKWRD
ncbi:hypothetical protein KY330_05645 [Candidatus Woesearchaeota archaeon]|nr:hypothetical protein [Candidatus Woesearchaeota archaeon]